MADDFPGFFDWLGENVGNQALAAQGYDPTYMRFLQHAQQAGGQAQQLIPQGVDPQGVIDAVNARNARDIGAQFGNALIMGTSGVKDTPFGVPGGVIGNAARSDTVAVGSAGQMADAAPVGAAPVQTPLGPPIVAYHGSPHDFDAFDASKIGTGEGAQAYGHGLYFAENEGVARSYRDKLAPLDLGQSLEDKIKAVTENPALGFPEALRGAIKRQLHTNTDMKPGGADGLLSHWQEAGAVTPEQAAIIKQGFDAALASHGRMYQVGIHADPQQFLDWDKPLYQQTDQVKSALTQLGVDASPRGQWTVKPTAKGDKWTVYNVWGEPAGTFASRATAEAKATLGTERHNRRGGETAYTMLGGNGLYSHLDRGAASQALNQAGIPGIKYLDGGSRSAGDGTRNYVVFNPELIEILKKYGIAGLTAGGASVPFGWGSLPAQPQPH